MAKRFYRKLGILAKVEATYGVDPTPTGAANAMLATEVTLTPLAADQVQRNLLTPYFGDQGSVLAGAHNQLEFSVELAGAGAAGTVPAWGVLMRACAMSEVVTATTKVEYQPISNAVESAALYCNLDGVNHVMVGARGSVTLDLTPKQIPHLKFNFMGLLTVAATDLAPPAPNYAAFQTPVICSKANTLFSLFGVSPVMESLNIDLGNQVEVRTLVGEESILITDRQAKGQAVVEAVSLATKDWYGIALASTKGALAVQHGTVAGNIVTIAAPKVQIGAPTYGNTQGVLNNTLPLMFTANTGDDELVITVK